MRPVARKKLLQSDHLLAATESYELRRYRSLLMPDKTVKALTIGQQPSPDVLTAPASGLAPGDYRIRWQVLASDGHITRGEVPFTVTP